MILTFSNVYGGNIIITVKVALLFSILYYRKSQICVNPAITCQVQLFIYFMLKYAMEILVAESSVVTGHYFIWSTTSVAFFLAFLGLTVLPVNVIVGNYISNMFEER